MRSDGAKRTQVWRPGDPGMVADYGLGFLPDGTVLAWYACCMEHTVAMVKHGTLAPLIRGDDGSAMVFQDWLPNGSGMLFSHPNGHYDSLFATDKTGHRLHEYPQGHPLAATIWQARLSPDGSRLLLAYSAAPVSLQQHDISIATVDLHSHQVHILLQGLADHLGSPTWSPDGGHIAYVACPSARAQSCRMHDIWFMDADGSHRQDITRGTLGDVQAVSWMRGALNPLPHFSIPLCRNRCLSEAAPTALERTVESGRLSRLVVSYM